MKYIIVTGSVESGVGKGITTSSIGVLLEACGQRLTVIKIDPYLNQDAGLMSPREHGEVFVLDDGSEVDLDLGNYERYFNPKLTKMNNITSGRVNEELAKKERSGGFLGKTVQVIPQATNFIIDLIRDTAVKAQADICLIELGGTIGGIESRLFIEALAELKYQEGSNNVCQIEVTPVRKSYYGKDLKTMSLQRGILLASSLNMKPDVVVSASKIPINDDSIMKIARAARLPPQRIINLPKLKSVYQVPCCLQNLGLLDQINQVLQIDAIIDNSRLQNWQNISHIHLNSTRLVNIGLVGKYVNSDDAYTSVMKSLEHACFRHEAKPNVIMIDSEDLEKGDDDVAWSKLKDCSCLIIPGGFDKRGTEGMIKAIKWARLSKIPFLGVCLGFQMAVLEHARNVLGIVDATSQEFLEPGSPPSPQQVIIEMLDYQDPERKLGGTMRLGLKKTQFTKPSILQKLYDSEIIYERHRHRYEVDPSQINKLENDNFKFVAQNDDGSRMEVLELDHASHPYFVGVQYHPEFLSKPFKPSPPYLGLISTAAKLNGILNLPKNKHSEFCGTCKCK